MSSDWRADRGAWWIVRTAVRFEPAAGCLRPSVAARLGPAAADMPSVARRPADPCRDVRRSRQPRIPTVPLQHAPPRGGADRVGARWVGDQQRPASARRIRRRKRPSGIPTRASRRCRRRTPPTRSPACAIAIASSTLFWTPRAIRSGATTTAACARYGRTSGTVPVTTTCVARQRLDRRRRPHADDREPERRHSRDQCRQDVGCEPRHGVDVRPIVHRTGEHDRDFVASKGDAKP